MTPLVPRLTSTLEQILILLREHGEEHWSEWLSRDLELIRSNDPYGLQHFLSAYGGMGSFNDLYLCTENGHRISEAEVAHVNDSLRRLASEAYDLAREIDRERGVRSAAGKSPPEAEPQMTIPLQPGFPIIIEGCEYLGRGPGVSGDSAGWSRSSRILYRCVECGDTMAASHDDDFSCTCGHMFVDRDAHRFGSRLGDQNILVYRVAE